MKGKGFSWRKTRFDETLCLFKTKSLYSLKIDGMSMLIVDFQTFSAWITAHSPLPSDSSVGSEKFSTKGGIFQFYIYWTSCDSGSLFRNFRKQLWAVILLLKLLMEAEGRKKCCLQLLYWFCQDVHGFQLNSELCSMLNTVCNYFKNCFCNIAD